MIYEPALELGHPDYIIDIIFDGPCCPALHPEEDTPYRCTLPDGHKGKHAAHGGRGVMFASWDEEPKQ